MEKLPPIPTPVSAQWREFRYQYLPLITFICIVGIVVVMWHNYVVPPTVLAQVETVTANVVSIQPGVLVSLDVERFQRVTNGQVIGVVRVLETNLMEASLAVIKADLQVMHDRIGVDDLRANQTFQTAWLSFLQERGQHEMNKVSLGRYLADYLRASNSWFNVTTVTNKGTVLTITNAPLISKAQYDMAQALYEKTQVEVTQMQVYLAEKEKILPKMQGDSSKLLASIERDIAAQEERFKAGAQNIILRAPMDGTVSVISNHVGEGIVAGRPIVIITPQKSDRIIAYVRQPMNSVPTTNTVVMIRRQTFNREVGYGKIVQVGTQLEPMSPTLLANTGGKMIDMGLPFLVKISDKHLNLSPGERVDLILNPPTKPAVD